ncbi:MAG: alkaline phosphatase family protein [Phycisphaerales bacterium]|nr:MAG: alkaline phosphatase family protein [Phycisphaerales bacterium]
MFLIAGRGADAAEPQSAVSTSDASSRAPAVNRATENVIIVVIDGIRFTEVTAEYMPFTMGGIDPDTGLPVPDPLKAQGSFCAELYSIALSGTTPGHQTIISGVGQILKNNGTLETRQRTKDPNIFECFRREHGAPIEKTWIVAGKQKNLKYLDYSLNPYYGFNHRASIVRVDWQPVDGWVQNKALQIMNEHHPALMLVNLADVDGAGHTADWDQYTGAIAIADRIAYDFWQFIQSDEYYRNKTALILTTDHGRHSDGIASGFAGHGCLCRGCRHLLFLAIGPDFKTDFVSDSHKNREDLAPTVGAILGFQTPYAEGEVMTDLFPEPSIVRAVVTGGARRPRIAAGEDGLHLVWSEKVEQEWNICYSASDDDGATWSNPVVLFEAAQNVCYDEADVAVAGNRVVVAAKGHYPAYYGGATFAFRLYVTERPCGGVAWSEPEVLTSMEYVLDAPRVISSGDEVVVTVLERGRWLWSFARAALGEPWARAQIDDYPEMQKNIVSHCAVGNQQDVYATWPVVFATGTQDPTELQRKSNLYVASYDSDSASWGSVSLATENLEETVVCYDPASQLDENGLLRLVWGRYTDADDAPGTWEILGRMTVDGGQSWLTDEAEVLSEDGIDCWNPDLSLIGPPGTPALVVWQAQRAGASEIEGSLDCKATGHIDISGADGVDSVEPDVVSYAGETFVTWQDRESGNWTIKCQAVEVEVAGDADDNYVVDIDDVFSVLYAWGTCDDPENCPADLTGDGVVDIDDIFAVLDVWGPCPEAD